MNANTCGLIVYTQNGAIPFEVIKSTEDFEDRVAQALEQGTVLLNLADGGQIVLCAINVVAIEICDVLKVQQQIEMAVASDEELNNTPPVQRI